MSDDAVLLDGIAYRYGTVTAVEDLHLRVGDGEMVGLIGPDGAGKTTALRILLGLLPAHAGTLRVCGVDPRREPRQLASRVGYLSQRFSLYGDLTVDENVAFFAEIHDVPRHAARRDELLDLVRLTPFRRRLADRLSGGMRQKLALACTLIHTPRLLVLDEPTTGVDPVSRRDFWRLLSRLNRGGLSILMTTPYLDEAERCHRVALLDHGRLLAAAPPRELQDGFPGAVLELAASPRTEAHLALRAIPAVTEVTPFGDRLHVVIAPGADPGVAAAAIQGSLLAAGMTVTSLRRVTPSLEDVFIARVSRAAATT